MIEYRFTVVLRHNERGLAQDLVLRMSGDDAMDEALNEAARAMRRGLIDNDYTVSPLYRLTETTERVEG